MLPLALGMKNVMWLFSNSEMETSSSGPVAEEQGTQTHEDMATGSTAIEQPTELCFQ